ncbi:MAG: replication factor C large subunit [Methanospirillaceae archaeon]|nr:replication factor C large subunit [Methanospirillaceae archaeon]
MDWVEKYRPSHITELVGNRDVIKRMVEWAQKWTPASKPLLLYGKPGIGKTSGAHALANDMDWEVLELNASDQRTKDVIERIAGSGSTTQSLYGAKQKLIILDEADNLQGNADRGGARAISSVLKNARQPVILIANDAYGITPEIQKISEKLQFKAVQARSIASRLKDICLWEGVTCSEEALMILAQRAQGDIRSAVNMLYASSIGNNSLTSQDLFISKKDHRSSIFDLVGAVFGMKEDQNPLQMSYEVDETPDRILPWIEEQIPKIPDISGQNRSYHWLARADRYLGRTFRMQYYTLWRYASALMVFCVSVPKGQNIRFRVMPPHRRNRIATAKKQQQIRHAILSRLADTLHISQAHILEEYTRCISFIAANDPKTFAKTFACDKEQLFYITGDPELAGSVMAEIEQEEKKRLESKGDEKIKKKKQKKDEEEQGPVLTDQTKPETRDQEETPLSNNQSTLFHFGV